MSKSIKKPLKISVSFVWGHQMVLGFCSSVKLQLGREVAVFPLNRHSRSLWLSFLQPSLTHLLGKEKVMAFSNPWGRNGKLSNQELHIPHKANGTVDSSYPLQASVRDDEVEVRDKYVVVYIRYKLWIFNKIRSGNWHLTSIICSSLKAGQQLEPLYTQCWVIVVNSRIKIKKFLKSFKFIY